MGLDRERGSAVGRGRAREPRGERESEREPLAVGERSVSCVESAPWAMGESAPRVVREKEPWALG